MDRLHVENLINPRFTYRFERNSTHPPWSTMSSLAFRICHMSRPPPLDHPCEQIDSTGQGNISQAYRPYQASSSLHLPLFLLPISFFSSLSSYANYSALIQYHLAQFQFFSLRFFRRLLERYRFEEGWVLNTANGWRSRWWNFELACRQVWRWREKEIRVCFTVDVQWNRTRQLMYGCLGPMGIR